MSKIFSTFFLGRPNWFSELSQSHYKGPFLPKLLRRRQNCKKQTKKGIFRPLKKLVFIGAKGAFRKILGSVTKNGYLKIVQKGDKKVPLNPPLNLSILDISSSLSIFHNSFPRLKNRKTKQKMLYITSKVSFNQRQALQKLHKLFLLK